MVFAEHKYPTEEMKSQLAEQIGLTEKQVSGWFCHRRLKEKRLSADEGFAGGRQDRSSGVIQDRGSGLRQDSCGSTKQGDYRSIDPREVQSRMLYGHDFPAADLAYDHRSQYTTHASGRDDTSSESSSFLRDRLYSQGDEPYAMETSSYIRQNGAITPVNHSSDRSKEYKPSGYLKVKGETENVAISAVKRQLGRHYREDGPPLGVEFDPLPPGAFESRSGDPVNGKSLYLYQHLIVSLVLLKWYSKLSLCLIFLLNHWMSCGQSYLKFSSSCLCRRFFKVKELYYPFIFSVLSHLKTKFR